MTSQRIFVLAALALTVGAAARPALGQTTSEPAAGLNIVTNSSFEGDWYNTRSEIMGCPVEPRVTFGQADSIPDGWKVTQPGATPAPVEVPAARSAEAHSGRYGLALAPTQTLLQENLGYGLVAPGAAFAAAPVRLSAWVKGGEANVTVTLTGPLTAEMNKETDAAKKAALATLVTKQAKAPAGANWARVVVDVPAAEIDAAVKGRAGASGVINATVRIDATGAAAVIVDDVKLERPFVPSPYSLVANGGFETEAKPGEPAEWSGAKKSLRHTGKTWYYIWRTWYHYMGVPRGDNTADQLVALSGKNAFRMNVPPGDEKYIESAAIALNQTAPERMAIRFDFNSYMLADLVVRVIDDEGHEVFFDHYAPGTTGGWQSYQREFTPRPILPKETSGGSGVATAEGAPKAIKSCRVRIGVKGVNGSNHDDINQWVNVNHAGVLWLDNVALVSLEKTREQLAAAGTKVFDADAQARAVLVEAIDLGERLFGQNSASVTLLSTGNSGANQEPVTLTINGPVREDDPQKAGYANGSVGQDKMIPQPKASSQTASPNVAVAPGARVTVTIPYKIEQLAEDWRSEYRVEVNFGTHHSTWLTFGTWSQQVSADVLRAYSFPGEAEQTVSLNFGVARETLAKAAKVNVDIRLARDNALVQTQPIENFQQVVAGFNVAQLPLPPDPKTPPDSRNYGWQGDATNFCQVKLNIAALPVHSQTEPVRDYYVRVTGVDAAGKTLFTGDSPRFGRVEEPTEKLAPITSVAIQDDALIINGKPFLPRGHIQMQQNFGPSPLSHEPVDFKKLGFNTAGHGQSATQQMLEVEPGTATLKPGGEKISKREFIWRQNMYFVSHRLPGKPPMSPAVEAEIRDVLNHPAAIGVNYIEWEGAPEAGTTPDDRIAYAKAIKKIIGPRPLWISAGWYSPTLNGPVYPDYLEHDFFAPESHSYFGPSNMDKEITAKKHARGEQAILGTFPNTFNEMPYEVERFEHWTDIIRGHRGGYMIIGLPGDATLYRGMNGEMRFIESFLFSKDKAPDVTAAPNVEHLVRSANGKTYIMASNAGPVIGGDWKWNTEVKDKGVASHTGDALWSRFHPYMKDYHSHYYKDDRPTTLKKGDKIVQYVQVPAVRDGGGPPLLANPNLRSLVLMVRGNGDWSYQGVWGQWDHNEFTDSGVRMWLAKDMHTMFWGTVGFCGPEGHDPKTPALLQHVFTEQQFHKIGALPAAGQWQRYEVPIEQFGLSEGMVIDGFGFVSKGENVWWERTALLRDGKEIELCNGSAGISPDKLKAVRFNVPGLKAGTKVKVMFDEREIVAQDGYFEDDLSGKPGYDSMWVGVYGDKIGETGYYGDGTFYNYNWGKVAARLYEIP